MTSVMLLILLWQNSCLLCLAHKGPGALGKERQSRQSCAPWCYSALPCHIKKRPGRGRLFARSELALSFSVTVVQTVPDEPTGNAILMPVPTGRGSEQESLGIRQDRRRGDSDEHQGARATMPA